MGGLRVLLSVRSVSCLQERAGRQSATQICAQTAGPQGVLGCLYCCDASEVVSGVRRPAAAGERGATGSPVCIFIYSGCRTIDMCQWCGGCRLQYSGGGSPLPLEWVERVSYGGGPGGDPGPGSAAPATLASPASAAAPVGAKETRTTRSVRSGTVPTLSKLNWEEKPRSFRLAYSSAA